MRRPSWVLGLVVVVGCTGKSGGNHVAPAKQVAAAPSEHEADAAPAEPAPTEPAPTQPAPTEPQAAAGDEADAGKAAPDRGDRFLDPPWFRKTMFADATNVDFKRSQVDERGLFSSQLLFDLVAGTTADDCAKALQEKVGGSVEGLTREEAEGRVTIKGTTDRYRVIMMCGEAKGVMKAYVSYQWTS